MTQDDMNRQVWPKWANWRATDKDGERWWYADEPHICPRWRDMWVVAPSKMGLAGESEPCSNWRNSKERRPLPADIKPIVDGVRAWGDFEPFHHVITRADIQESMRAYAKSLTGEVSE